MSNPTSSANIPFLFPFSVVLLDTTAAIGELGWKTFPLNGVSHSPFWFYCLDFGILTLCKWMAIIPQWIFLQYRHVRKILVDLKTGEACVVSRNNGCKNNMSAHCCVLLLLFWLFLFCFVFFPCTDYSRLNFAILALCLTQVHWSVSTDWQEALDIVYRAPECYRCPVYWEILWSDIFTLWSSTISALPVATLAKPAFIFHTANACNKEALVV